MPPKYSILEVLIEIVRLVMHIYAIEISLKEHHRDNEAVCMLITPQYIERIGLLSKFIALMSDLHISVLLLRNSFVSVIAGEMTTLASNRYLSLLCHIVHVDGRTISLNSRLIVASCYLMLIDPQMRS